MPTRHPRSHVWIWIACFAVILNALAPAVSRLLAAAGMQGLETIEVCTSAGLRRIVVPTSSGGSAPIEHSSLKLDHCPYCLTHAGSFVLPPTAPTTIALPVAGHVLVEALPTGVHARHAVIAPLARAPPPTA